MGLRERFLTAGVAIPLALWAIAFDARLCLALVLVLQAISVQELNGLLQRTRRVPCWCTKGHMPHDRGVVVFSLIPASHAI